MEKTKFFRGTKVEGWEVVEDTNREQFQEKINHLMERFDFMDFQFSTCYNRNLGYVVYTATVLKKRREE